MTSIATPDGPIAYHCDKGAGEGQSSGAKGRRAEFLSALCHEPCFGTAVRRLPSIVQTHLDHLGQVQRLAVGLLLDLLAATEAVADEHRLIGRAAHAREQDALATGDRD